MIRLCSTFRTYLGSCHSQLFWHGVHDRAFEDEICAEISFEVTLALAVVHRDVGSRWAGILLETVWSCTGTFVTGRIFKAWLDALDTSDDIHEKLHSSARELMFPIDYLPADRKCALQTSIVVARATREAVYHAFSFDMNEATAADNHHPVLTSGLPTVPLEPIAYVLPPRTIVKLYPVFATADDEEIAASSSSPSPPARLSLSPPLPLAKSKAKAKHHAASFRSVGA